ncbi:succinyl-diaminopimelate desuccinylase [Clostridium tetanomorphum]|uniref:Dipeptidase PepV n=1 Tax=Clostridium tetanomorphum TaxID=1553 RepID=A0A923EC41_CLOTT|nr:dipeptidase PepV [Clostridium tetanomorphum]KAJ50619.1 dipeptidase PepV [Clostridium tetanomorphum DSM 665]MBC2399079.1 dipeptidase PepV [Clostridium tetanomorphum]MBP1862694.1 succinyl-diaminopimelate desuccinylase [Clostridium tetanomorphum]NRS85466.1 succinyl-diaminopimelate desuccinylase [Clostridium tetanomorphum]NRZ98580.1 succinyl-diaminopimelate desuccinylase [Clostridium tetanomorphum]
MELNRKINELKEDLIESTQEIMKIKSVEEEGKEGMPFGEGVSKALECALKISRRLGFKTKNLDGYVGYAEYGEGEEYVGVLGHLDVVPEGEGWKYPPYSAEIHEGKIYGRGALDDKGPIMAALYGLKAVKDLKLPLSKKIRIIFGTNEETGSKEMEYYLKREKPPVSGFTPDAEYPLIYAEKGITSFNLVKDLKTSGTEEICIKYIKGGQRVNMVPDYCEAGIWAKEKDLVIKALEKFKLSSEFNLTAHIKSDMVVIKSVGVSAHGSLPKLGINAIMQMFKFLESLPIEDTDIYELISFFNKYVGFECHGESFGVALEDEESGKLSFNVGTVEMDSEKISLGLNLRYPVTYTFDDLMKPFEKTLEGTGIRIEDMAHQKPLYFPKDHELIKTLLNVYTDQTGERKEPLAIGGGTYAKEMPNIVAFGPIFPGKPDLDHQVNEYIEIEDLIMNAKIYAHAIYELAK